MKEVTAAGVIVIVIPGLLFLIRRSDHMSLRVDGAGSIGTEKIVRTSREGSTRNDGW